MVRVKISPWLQDGKVDIDVWLQQFATRQSIDDLNLIRKACTVSQSLNQYVGSPSGTTSSTEETGISCLQLGLAMADLLADLNVDPETLVAAILFNSVHKAKLPIEEISKTFGQEVAKLIYGVEQMKTIRHLRVYAKPAQRKMQVNNLRKMLLAMVDDVRVVLVTLADRLCALRDMNAFPSTIQQIIAAEAMDIYAPLANRLGIGAIKWEMEDLAFRILQPAAYQEIAKGLKTKRLERDHYVQRIVQDLENAIRTSGISHFSVYGRSKHIHSIYRKMQRKNVPLTEIYDATAIRVLVDTTVQCYEVVGLVHELWKQIPSEFDDYITHPKANGYQSLHTAVEGPQQQVFEVQIRTYQMHEWAERGIASHWKYKEGGGQTPESHERKIAWLRDVLAWHQEMVSMPGETGEALDKEFLEDRVYVLSPENDVYDLPSGATPLDFAYHIHTSIGHRCRGAKVNGIMVPLISLLKTGDRIEILLGKEERPSRDWVSPHRGYLVSSRARSKILHWFKMQDYDRDKNVGQEQVEKAFKALGFKIDKLNAVFPVMRFKRLDDLLVAIGRGEVKLNQLLHRFFNDELLAMPASSIPPKLFVTRPTVEAKPGQLYAEGIGHLIMHIAGCCSPLEGEPVIGYITVGRGVSVHKQNCPNIVRASKKQKDRLLQVRWGRPTTQH